VGYLLGKILQHCYSLYLFKASEQNFLFKLAAFVEDIEEGICYKATTPSVPFHRPIYLITAFYRELKERLYIDLLL